MNNILMNFPELHPGLVAGPLPGAVRFLDPGLGPDRDPAALTPDTLPLTGSEAAAYLRDFLAYGEQLGTGMGLAALGARGLEDYYTGTSLEVHSDLLAAERGQRRDLLGESRRAAQLTLLLGWSMEERRQEMSALNDRLRATWERFGRSLGLAGLDGEAGQDDEDLAELGHVALAPPPVVDLSGDRLPWRRVLEAFLVLLPQSQVLFTTSQEVLEDLDEHGLCPVQAEPGEGGRLGLGDGPLWRVTAPGWRLLTRKREPKDAGWLLGERTVFISPAGPSA